MQRIRAGMCERTSPWANAISEKELQCSEFELACVNGRLHGRTPSARRSCNAANSSWHV
ncbi:MAG TPA: hypothetical protein H9730_11305 [Candidatus Mediterraneibacter stercoripullorum]|nr:hypothetical protein [Candidatus Mediterraneibacter stercoripullorum]